MPVHIHAVFPAAVPPVRQLHLPVSLQQLWKMLPVHWHLPARSLLSDLQYNFPERQPAVSGLPHHLLHSVASEPPYPIYLKYFSYPVFRTLHSDQLSSLLSPGLSDQIRSD